MKLETRGIAAAWVILAALPLFVVAASHGAFDYTQAWVSAHYGTMARTFARAGAFALGGLPVQNNLPLTTEPDFYLNWPPLYPILLSFVMRLVGDNPRVFHLLMAALALGNAVMLGRLAGRYLGRLAGTMAAAAFLLMPITLNYGFGVFHIHLAIAFGLGSLLVWTAWLDQPSPTRLAIGAGLLFFGLLTSWEPILLTVGAFAGLLLDRSRKGTLGGSFVIAAAGALGIVAVAALYLSNGAWVFEQLRARFLQRAGIAEYAVGFFRAHGLEEYFEPKAALANKIPYVVHLFYERAELLGGIALVSLAATPFILAALWSEERWRRVGQAFLALLGLWLIWALLMRQHYIIHEYEAVIAAPTAALAVGIAVGFIDRCRQSIAGERSVQAINGILLIGLPIALLIGAFGSFWQTLTDDTDAPNVAFGRFINQNVPAGAIVLTTERSMVPVYYADRHMIRAVVNEGVIHDHWDSFAALCASCEIYVAFPTNEASNFAVLTSSQQPVAAQPKFVIYRLNAPPTTPGLTETR